ncbi:MAG: TIM barrel protein [Firmicutes bacterium]|nr:TIM barrel protein [Bacillota bacterium]
MARVLLGMNCNFAANRYTEPEEWTRIVGEELGLRYVQYASDLLDPYLPDAIQKRVCAETRAACDRYGIQIYAAFGGHFAHQHYLGHPDDEIRAEGERWMKRLIAQAAMLGAKGTGTCFAIMSARDTADPQRREYITEQAVQAYRRLADYAAEVGLEYLMFEPTSVPREMACTISETSGLLERCANMAVPMRLCLDVGHGSVNSGDPADADPCAWIRTFGKVAPVIHIQQTDKECSRHWPFTSEYNAQGVIKPQDILKAIEDSGAEEVLLVFEVSHKAFYPDEDRVIDDLKESVEYWRQYVKE